MIELQNTILSDEIAEEYFFCDLAKCKGACCVEGDLGAPLEKEELPIIEEIIEKVRPYLSEASKKVLDRDGGYVLDHEGEFSTSTIGGKECVFAIYDDRGILKCGIEKAWSDGKIGFRKPLSCHLYPIRMKQYDEFIAINYDRWSICAPACAKGESMKIPLYKFLKEPLIRKFGEDWYDELVSIIES